MLGPLLQVYCVVRVVLEQAMERDKFMNPSEAKDFGILDLVLEHPPLPTNETDTSQTT